MAQPGPAGQRQADLAMIAIRRARPAEAARLSEIAFAAKASWGYSPSFMARCRAALAVDPKTIVEGQFHLAEGEDGTILGFYGFGPDPEGIELSHIFVAPEAIGQGIGRLLWHHAVALAQHLGEAQLLVVSDPMPPGSMPAWGHNRRDIDPRRL